MLRPRLGRAFPLVVILIIVLVLALFAAGLYFGDRFAEHRAEQRAAAALQPRLGTPQPPQVDIEGFPFLTQVASRSVDRVHIWLIRSARRMRRCSALRTQILFSATS